MSVGETAGQDNAVIRLDVTASVVSVGHPDFDLVDFVPASGGQITVKVPKGSVKRGDRFDVPFLGNGTNPAYAE